MHKAQYSPELTPYFWEMSKLNRYNYNVFVETGSYRGETIAYLKNKFTALHSIEITEKWYKHCVDRFKYDAQVHIHFGDSATKLPEILDRLNKPAIVFLDAHYSGGTTGKAGADCDSSLLVELQYLRNRPFDDIIIIDDTSFFGAVGGEEPTSQPGDDIVWPPFRYNWQQVQRDQVLSLMKQHYRMVENSNSTYTITPREDQMIWYPVRHSE